MADHTSDGLSAIWQGVIAFGLFIGGVIAGLVGRQAKDSEAENLRFKLEKELLRRDLETVFTAQRIATDQRMREIESDLDRSIRAIELSIHEKIDSLSVERRHDVRSLDERVRDIEIGRRSK